MRYSFLRVVLGKPKGDQNSSNNQKQPPQVFYKKGILNNFTKFTGKRLCQGLFLHKIAGLRPAALLKKRLWNRFFPTNFVKFLRTSFFT